MSVLDRFIKNPIPIYGSGCGSKVLRFVPIDSQTRPFQNYREHHFQNRMVRCFKQLEQGRWVGDCPLCTAYNELWKAADKRGGGWLFHEFKIKPEDLIQEARQIKPIERFRFLAIERETSDGVKIFSCGKVVSQMILAETINNSKPPEVETPKRCNCWMHRLYRWAFGKIDTFLIDHAWKEEPEVKVEDWTPFSAQHGKDFLLRVQFRGGVDCRFPCYDLSKFLDRSPLGTPEQIEEWGLQARDLAQYMQPPFENKEVLWQQVVDAYPNFDIPFEAEEYEIPAKKDLADWPYAEEL